MRGFNNMAKFMLGIGETINKVMKNIILALLAGVAAGILLAPDKGSETRKKLFGKIGDLSDDISDGANDLYKQGKRALQEGVSKGKSALSE
jgi:gas vesicle protein